MEDDDAGPLVPLDGMDGEEVPAVEDDTADEARDDEDESIMADDPNELAALVLVVGCKSDDDGLPEDAGAAELDHPLLEVDVRLLDEPPPRLLDPELCGLTMEDAWPPEDDVEEGWLLQRPLTSHVLPGGQSVSVLHTMPWVHPTARPNTPNTTSRPTRASFMAAPNQTRRRPACPT